jgi:hypothetical protein
MATPQLNPQQRDAIDAQIRERLMRDHPVADEVVSSVIFARKQLGAGWNLENACPYFRTCEYKTSAKICIGNVYRFCQHYQLDLADDMLEGRINFQEAGIDLQALGLDTHKLGLEPKAL